MLMIEQDTYIKTIKTTTSCPSAVLGDLDRMPECPICNKEFSAGGPHSYRAHLQSKHPQDREQARRLRQLATLTLIISLALTLLLVTVFYYPDQLGYTMMGLATLFLCFHLHFLLRREGSSKDSQVNTALEKRDKIRNRQYQFNVVFIACKSILWMSISLSVSLLPPLRME